MFVVVERGCLGFILVYRAVGRMTEPNRVAYGERYYFYSTYRVCMPIEPLRAASLARASMKKKS